MLPTRRDETDHRQLITVDRNRAGKKLQRTKSPEDRKPADIRSQEKKWHDIPEQYAAFADAKAPSYF
jgi:hypothetical protein